MAKVVVRMAGGLANRMFQYTYYLYLKKHGIDAYVDNNYKATKWKMEDIDWGKIFPNAPIDQAPSSLVFLLGGSYNTFSKIRRHIPGMSRVKILQTFDYVPYEDFTKSTYVIGVLHNHKVADDVREQACKSFVFSPFEDDKNKAMLSEIEGSESVAIHLRKGKDYMQKAITKGTCTLEYYQKAIDIIKSKVSNPKFYVFTDNAEWVRENLMGIDYKLVDINPAIGWGNHFDMQLMSHCKHNIIANSTYSWWGAYLNQNKDKIVIAPKTWFNPEVFKEDVSDKTICYDWIAI